jgi:hypothetical protein
MLVKGVCRNSFEDGHASPGPGGVVSPEPSAIRSELERILGSTSFRNSKRYSALLRYLVEQTLEGKSDHLKERTIGVEVFDRSPDYDSNSDHVVRSAASEVRKRLALYYQGPENESGIRIDLHPGGYIPGFRMPQPPASEIPVSKPPAQAEAVPTRRRGWQLHLLTASAAVILTLAISALASWHSTTALDRFWGPVIKQPGSVIVCVGRHVVAPTAGEPASPAALTTGGDGSSEIGRGGGADLVIGGNALALARLAGQLQMRGKPFRVFLGSSASFEDIQERAAVLIGVANNEWAIQVLKGLRFHIDGPGGPIIDQARSAPGNMWVSTRSSPGYGKFYALVARYTSSQTGRITVVAGGSNQYGSVAAGQFLSDESLMSELEARAPGGWERMNMETVLVADVIRGVGGRPRIVATHFW